MDISRRSFGLSAAALVVGTAAAIRAPFVHASERPSLRVLGTHVTLREDIRKRAEQDLGMNISFEPGGDAHIL